MDDKTRPLLDDYIAAGAVSTGGHYVYTSGRHGREYIEKEKIFEAPELLRRMAQKIVEVFSGEQVDAVVGPERGGARVALSVSAALGECDKRWIPMFAAAKEQSGGFVFHRETGDFLRTKRVLVVDDVLTTGISMKRVVALVRRHGGRIAGVAVLVNRSQDRLLAECSQIPILYAVINEDVFETFEPDSCPLCAAGLPVNTDLGHGAEFLARHAN